MHPVNPLIPVSLLVQVPACIYEIVATPDEHLRTSATRSRTFAVNLSLVNVRRINYDGVAIDLYFGFWKLQLHQLPATVSEALRPFEDSRAIGPTLLAAVDRDCFFRNQLVQEGSIICKPRLPHCFARGEYLFA